MRRLILNSQGNEKMFIKEMETKINHYCGIHGECPDTESSICKKLHIFEDHEATKDFMVLFVKFLNNIDCLV